MFGSKNTKTTTAGTTTTANTGLLSRLRSSNRPATAKKPVYTSGSSRTTAGTTRGTTGTSKFGFGRKKKSVATGPAPMSHHRTKPTLSQKIHGAATVASGKMHNNHREVRAGESKSSNDSLHRY